MRNLQIAVVLAAMLSTQVVLADDMMSDSKSCGEIAKACEAAGFKDKSLWFDCMKPVLMGKTVDKVTIDAATAKSCRMDKMEQMKKTMKEFEGVK